MRLPHFEVVMYIVHTRSCERLKTSLLSFAMRTLRIVVLCPESTAIALEGTYGFQKDTKWSREPVTSKSKG